MCKACDPPPRKERGLGDMAAAQGASFIQHVVYLHCSNLTQPSAGWKGGGPGPCHQCPGKVLLSSVTEDAEVHLEAHPSQERIRELGRAQPGKLS